MTTERWVPLYAASLAGTQGEVSSSSPGERRLAAWSYAGLFVTGLAVLGAAGRGNRFARWHAIQAVAFGVVALLTALLLQVLSLAAVAAASPFLTAREVPVYALPLLVAFIALGFIAVMAWEALKGRTVRLPLAAPLADRLA